MTAKAKTSKAPPANNATVKPADAAATKPDAAATKPDAVTAEVKTRVKTLQEGQDVYWRGGQGHTKEWQTWPPGTYSAEQIERLEADERVEVEAIQA